MNTIPNGPNEWAPSYFSQKAKHIKTYKEPCLPHLAGIILYSHLNRCGWTFCNLLPLKGRDVANQFELTR